MSKPKRRYPRPQAAELAHRLAERRRFIQIVAGAVLVLDEIQKIPGWSETTKRLWDDDTRARRRLRVVLLGSAPLLIARGMSESLAGRFETLHVPHWSFAEMRAAFGWSLDEYLFHGGYPGAAPLVVKAGPRITAIEVKSGRAPLAQAGTAAFAEAFAPKRTLLVGGDGVSVEEFLLRLVAHCVGAAR